MAVSPAAAQVAHGVHAARTPDWLDTSEVVDVVAAAVIAQRA